VSRRRRHGGGKTRIDGQSPGGLHSERGHVLTGHRPAERGRRQHEVELPVLERLLRGQRAGGRVETELVGAAEEARAVVPPAAGQCQSLARRDGPLELRQGAVRVHYLGHLPHELRRRRRRVRDAGAHFDRGTCGRRLLIGELLTFSLGSLVHVWICTRGMDATHIYRHHFVPGAMTQAKSSRLPVGGRDLVHSSRLAAAADDDVRGQPQAESRKSRSIVHVANSGWNL
jgi:hypothetical protein